MPKYFASVRLSCRSAVERYYGIKRKKEKKKRKKTKTKKQKQKTKQKTREQQNLDIMNWCSFGIRVSKISYLSS